MLKINVVCVGNIKDKFFEDAQNEYKKRLQKYCTLNILELKELNYLDQQSLIIEKESEEILQNIKGHFVLLDVLGKQMTSEKFADFLNELQNISSEITFVIGGSYGVSEKLKKLAKNRISFSQMTFPHRLFRVMLLEQIYRAFCINSGSPYHK